MNKLKPADLEKIAQRMKGIMTLREGDARVKIIVHMGTCGIAAGARPVMAAFRTEIDEQKIDDVLLTISSCAGLCSREPMVTVDVKDEPAVKYVDMTAEKVKTVFEKHVVGGEIVTEYALAAGSERVM